jgi:hypothetical protein
VAGTNPIDDTTGDWQALGQSGHVWFLAGMNPGGAPVDRHVTVPVGKMIFLPLANMLAWFPFSDEGIAELRLQAGEQMANIADTGAIACEIDGVALKNLTTYRARDPYANGFYIDVGGDNYGPAVTDGFWLMLKPLTPGEHTIHWTTTSVGFWSIYWHNRVVNGLDPAYEVWNPPFDQDVTYHLTVK